MATNGFNMADFQTLFTVQNVLKLRSSLSFKLFCYSKNSKVFICIYLGGWRDTGQTNISQYRLLPFIHALSVPSIVLTCYKLDLTKFLMC